MQPGTRVTFTDSSGKTWPGVIERIDTTTYSISMASVKLDGEEMRLFRSVADLEPEATPQFNAEQLAEMARLKQYFPFRIVWGAIDPRTGEFRCSANPKRRQANDLIRKGWHVAVVK